MGKQSARIYFQGKDHKEIYYQGHYHKAMYIGSQLVWEKIEGTTAQEIYLEYLVYGNGLYVGCDYFYNSTGNTVGIYAGTDLENMHLVGKLDKSNVWYRGIIMFINDVYIFVTKNHTWHTFKIKDNELLVESYAQGNMPFPVLVDLNAADGNDYATENKPAAIMRDRIHYTGYNNFNYWGGVPEHERIIDVFLKDSIVWGISISVYAEKNMEYLYQYFYSIDEKHQLTTTELRFPDETVEVIKTLVTKNVKEKLLNTGRGWVLRDIKFNPTSIYSIVYLPEGFTYIINNKMYLYYPGSIFCKTQAAPKDDPDCGELYINKFDWAMHFTLYWKIDLDKLEVIDFYVDDNPDGSFCFPKWDMPAIGEIRSKYETNEFVIYKIKDASQNDSSDGHVTYERYTHIIYNIKAEGDTVHKLFFSDIDSSKGGLGGLEDDCLLHAAYLKDDYLHIDITIPTCNADGNYFQSPKTFLKINIKTNKGETYRVHTKYIPE